MKKYLQEPFLHFLVLGGLIFLLYAYVNHGFTPEDKKVVITQAKIKQLEYIWQKKYMRKPTNKELEKIIAGEVYNEVMSREAVKLGLDKEDGIIRRRLVQKMSFVSSNFAALVEPTEKELRTFLAQHQKEFMSEQRISFLLQSSVILGKEQHNMSEWEVSRNFWRTFAHKVFTLPVGVWSNDVMSAYGKVDVFVKEKTNAQKRPFSDIRPKLKAAWQLQEKIKLEKRFYEKLKNDYRIEIEK